MSLVTPLFYYNGMITHNWKGGVGVYHVTPLSAYTLSRNLKKKRGRKIEDKIEMKMNRDGLHQHHCSLELIFREERQREERDQIRLFVCSETCLSKSPFLFFIDTPKVKPTFFLYMYKMKSVEGLVR